jgi:ribosomal protein L2
MLINARDPRQWTYLRNLPKKKKKNPGINLGQHHYRAVGGGYYIPVGSVDLKNSEPSVPGIISKIKYEYGRTYMRLHNEPAGKG